MLTLFALGQAFFDRVEDPNKNVYCHVTDATSTENIKCAPLALFNAEQHVAQIRVEIDEAYDLGEPTEFVRARNDVNGNTAARVADCWNAS